MSSFFHRVTSFLVLVSIALFAGCTGVPLRDIGVLAGAAVGAEGNPGRPILGAVRGGIIGGAIGVVADHAVGQRSYSPVPVYIPQHQAPHYGGQGALTGCTTRIERDYRVPGSQTRVTTCSSERKESIIGGLRTCRARYVERQVGNRPPEVTLDNERCTESSQLPGYRRY